MYRSSSSSSLARGKIGFHTSEYINLSIIFRMQTKHIRVEEKHQ